MNQLTLEINSATDLELLLSLVQRLDIKVVSVVKPTKPTRKQQLAQLQAATKDPLFLADVAAITEDFKHADAESL